MVRLRWRGTSQSPSSLAWAVYAGSTAEFSFLEDSAGAADAFKDETGAEDLGAAAVDAT